MSFQFRSPEMTRENRTRNRANSKQERSLHLNGPDQVVKRPAPLLCCALRVIDSFRHEIADIMGRDGDANGTSVPGVAMARPPAGIGSRPIERASTRRNISRIAEAGCTPMVMPGSRASTGPTTSTRSPAWAMSGAGSSMSTGRPSPTRPAQLYAIEKEARGSPIRWLASPTTRSPAWMISCRGT